MFFLIFILFSLHNNEKNKYGLKYFFNFYSGINNDENIPDDDEEGIIHLCRSKMCCSCRGRNPEITIDEISDSILQIGEKIQINKNFFEEVHRDLKEFQIYKIINSFENANEKIPDLNYDKIVNEFEEVIEESTK